MSKTNTHIRTQVAYACDTEKEYKKNRNKYVYI